MKYYIYENWRAEKKCVIHTSSCRMCKDGKGIHLQSSEQNGKWHGPFVSYEDALKYAMSCENRVIKTCKICIPEVCI